MAKGAHFVPAFYCRGPSYFRLMWLGGNARELPPRFWVIFMRYHTSFSLFSQTGQDLRNLNKKCDEIQDRIVNIISLLIVYLYL